MQTVASNIRDARTETLAPRFALPFLAFCVLAALLITWKPIQLSVATVFLFAGPHNWIEFRYFLEKMPARWGRSKPFYAIALAGGGALTIAYLSLFILGQSWYLDQRAWDVSIAVWNSAVILWVALLVHLRGKQRGRRDLSWAFAAGFALCAMAWAQPLLFSLALVYLHPLVALCFLEREIRLKRPEWRQTYHMCLALLPVILVLMWTELARAQNLPTDDALAWRITSHAGASVLTSIPNHLLVATHVFLETVHYCAWLVVIPLVGMSRAVWSMKKIPLAVHKRGWPRTVRAALFLSALLVIALWIAFAADYATTRDFYFAFAMAHVLAEAPFLIRLL